MGKLSTSSQISAPSDSMRRDPGAPRAPGEGACRLVSKWHLPMSRWPPEKGPRVVPQMGPKGPSEEGGSQGWRGCQDEHEHRSGKTGLPIHKGNHLEIRPNQSTTQEARPGFKFSQPKENEPAQVVIKDGEGDIQFISVTGKTNCFLHVHTLMSLDFSTNRLQQCPSIICSYKLFKPHNNSTVISILWRKKLRLRKFK